ncbi:MAG: SEC-C metal-binding domain-containing protein, partial [Mycobacteriales bacterium]
MPRRTIADIAADLLAAKGPQPLDVVVAHVVAEGGTKAKHPKQAVLKAIEYARQVTRIPGDRYASMDALRQGRVFTHRVTEEELATERLVTAADLRVLSLPLHEVIPSNRGELSIIVERGQIGARPLTGPSGWLADLEPGDVVAVRYDGRTLDISPVEEVTPEPFVDRRLNSAIGEGLEAERAWGWDGAEPPNMPLAFQVHGILADDATAFTRPGLPLSERFPDFEVHGNLVGYPGTDWSELDWWDALDEDDDEYDEEDLDVAARYRLTGAAADALRDLVFHVDALELGGPLPDEVQARRLAEELAQVAEPFRSWCQLEGDPASVIRLGLLLTEHPDSWIRGVAWSVVATNWEELGDHGAAEEAIAKAVLANPSDDTTQLIAARYAGDRGDAAAAMAHLRAAGVAANDPEMQRLRPFAEPPASTVGRNAPCPCGSGKKHKQCCLRNAQHPLAARSPWLWQKLASWAREPRQREATLTVAQFLEPDDPMAAVRRALHDPITIDLALWDFELIPEFIGNRGGALPADELELLNTWVIEPIRVVEVIEV